MPDPKKQLGQHWLYDEASLKAMAEAGSVAKDDFIVEVGPGLGSLTEILLELGAKVTAVELDDELVKELKTRFLGNKDLNIVSQNILKFNFLNLPKNYKVVANIPYYLTSALIRLLSETANPPSLTVILVQKEVAERVCAKPGQMSLLSVSAQMYFEVSLGQVVKAELFIPPPKVDSQILIMQRRAQPLFGQQNSKELFRVVKAGFSERRKKLRSSLSGGLRISKTEADELLSKAGIDGELRAQNLTLQDWLKLTEVTKLK